MSVDGAFRTRLVKVLGMLGSAFDGERATAASTASRMLQESGLRWDDVVVSAATRPSDGTHRELAESLLQHDLIFTEWEIGFLESISNWFGSLTTKQQAVLSRLQEKASSCS
jgi:hypothetical protein